jgi:hypothetical protein
MTNLFVDAGCLAFPPETEKPLLEHENIREFLCGIRDPDMLIDRNPDIAVSIRREMEDFLEKENRYFDGETQKPRMKRQVNLKIDPRDVERIYPTLFCGTRTILFHCLETLAYAVQYLQNLPDELDEYEINGIVNHFGCNSATESNKYRECRYRRWHDGKECFSPASAPQNKQ